MWIKRGAGAVVAGILVTAGCSGGSAQQPAPSARPAAASASASPSEALGICGMVDLHRIAAAEGVDVALKATRTVLDDPKLPAVMCEVTNAADDLSTAPALVLVDLTFTRPAPPMTMTEYETSFLGGCVPAAGHGPYARSCPDAKAGGAENIYYARDGVLLHLSDLTTVRGSTSKPAPAAYFAIADAFAAQPWTSL